jgi:tetratricopeptide (TPR) repeat protein
MRRLLGAIAIALAAAGAAAPGRADSDDVMQAQALLMAGDLARAFERINAAIADDPEDATAYLVRARIWLMTREAKKAAEDYSQAIAHGLGRTAYVYTLRAGAWAVGHDYAQAAADYERALAINPGYWPAIAGRGIVLAEGGETARALADLDRALAHDPGDMKEVLKTEHVQVQSRKGPPQQGTNTLSVTVHSLPIMAQAFAARGKLRFGQGSYRPALADLDEAIKRVPALTTAHFYRGLTLLALGRCQEGEEEFRAPALRENGALEAALARHRDAVAKGGCAVEKL